MSYLRNSEEAWMPGGLGCGPNCKCGPCRAKFWGFGEQYIPTDEDEEQEPEQAPPAAEPAPDAVPADSTAQSESAQNVPPARASASRRVPRAHATSRPGPRAPRLAGYH